MPISELLLPWYDVHARDLPWRVPPGSSQRADPYHVWLSEIMLQQTTVAAVKPYFERFLTRWPRIKDLAAADEADVMRLWAGLGYYARARNLHACAKAVAATGGRFPQTQAALRELPGIGDYTSAAIAAIAFGERAAVVDGNVERVVTRLTADDTPLPKAKANVRLFMEVETPSERPGDFAQAMMDLGATVCTPKSPSCLLCPLNGHCEAKKEGRATDFPVKAPKKAKPVRRGAAFVAYRGDEVWLTRRPPSGLLGGMTQVPTTDWSARQDGARGADAAPFKGDWRHAGQAEHGFTHFGIVLDVFRAEVAAASGEGWWCKRAQLAHEALPTLFRKVVATAFPGAPEAGRTKS